MSAGDSAPLAKRGKTAREGYDIGPPSIAWLTWHIGFWWSMVLDHSFADGTLSRDKASIDGVRIIGLP